MKKFVLVFFFIIILYISLFAYETTSYFLEMRDGESLYTLVCTPDTTWVKDYPWPVIIERTPYGADDLSSLYTIMIATLCDVQRYAVVFQDLRGRNNSSGADSLFREDGWGSLQDGYDTMDWLVNQWWCNGKVGMYGESANAIVQYLAAGAMAPGLTALVPKIAAWNQYNFIYPGGEYRQYDVTKWVADYANPEMLPIVRENYLSNADVWNMNPHDRIDSITVPMIHIGGWMDCFAPSQIEAFYDLQYSGGDGALGNQKLIIGPWAHTTLGTNTCGEITFPDNAAIDIFNDYELPWYNYWIKGENNGIMDTSNIRLYLVGPTDTTGYWNNWLAFDEWPFDVSDTLVLYLSNDSLLRNPSNTDSLSYLYDPKNPVPTIGGQNLFLDEGYYDQDSVWTRDDVLTFVSVEISEPYDIFGRVHVKLYAKSNCKDTDFTAKLVDMYPDGKKMLIADGIIMARHRLGFDREDFLDSTTVYEFDIDLGYIAYTIVPSHRLGLAISSSNYPRFAVNPNTDYPVNQSPDTLVATNTVFMGELYPSQIILPLRNPLTYVENDINNSNTKDDLFYSNNILYIYSSDKENVKIAIYDITGRKIGDIYSGILNRGINRINVPSLREGIYIVQVKGEEKSITKKITVIE